MVDSMKKISKVNDRVTRWRGFRWNGQVRYCEVATIEQRHGGKIRDNIGKECKAGRSSIS